MATFKKIRFSIPAKPFQTLRDARAFMRCALWLALTAAMPAAIPAEAVNYSAPVKISTTPYNFWGIDGDRPINSQGQVVWLGDDENNSIQVYLYDGSKTNNISNNAANNGVDYEVINNKGCAAWTATWATSSMNFDVWYYCDGTTSKITNLGSSPPMSAVLGDLNDSGEIVYYGVTNTSFSGLIEYPGDILIAGEGVLNHPRLNNAGQIVYTDNNFQLHLYSGSCDQVISTAPVYGEFDVNDNGQIAWSTWTSSSLQSQVYLYDGHTIKNISDNSGENDFHSRGMLNANGDVVWLGPATDGSAGRDIYLYSGGVVRPVTSNGRGSGWPQMNDNDEIVWAGSDPSTELPCMYLYSGGVIQKFPYGTSSFPVINNQGKIVYVSLEDKQVYIISPVSAGLWHGAVDLGGGWYYLNWFGVFNTIYSPWIYHAQLGWLYPFGTDTSSIWFWDMKMNTFLWTNQTLCPFLWDVAENAWLYYVKGTSNPCQFYNYSTRRYENH